MGSWLTVGGSGRGGCAGSAADPQNWHKVQVCLKGAGPCKKGLFLQGVAVFNPEGHGILKQCRFACT